MEKEKIKIKKFKISILRDEFKELKIIYREKLKDIFKIKNLI